MLYIKDNIIKDSNLITIETEDSFIYNPDHDTLLSNGWEVYEEEPNTKIIENKGFVKTTSGEFELLDKSVYEDSIVFIEDTKLIWSNGVYYGTNSSIDVTYSELVSLRDNSQLIPGMLYRITDYITTTVQEGTQSSNNQFDIIVTADSENVLNENVRSANHENAYNIPNSVIEDLPEEDDPYRYDYFGIVEYEGKEYFGYIGNLNDYDFGADKSFDEIISDILQWGILFELNTNFTNLNPGEYLDFSYITWLGNVLYLTKNEFINHINYYDGAENLIIYGDELQLVNLDYFLDSNLNAWELKYSLDNDTTRFAWADTVNGKGVIYYMKDEYNNECPYDFKNIQFVRTTEWFSQHEDWCNNTIGNIPNQNNYYYTFTYVDENGIVHDASIIGNTLHNGDEGYITGVYGNVIKECPSYSLSNGLSNSLLVLPDNIFYTTGTDGEYYGCHSNTFGESCYANTFGNNCFSNTFGNYCFSNTFGNECIFNTFGDECISNTFGYSCQVNTFGFACSENTFGYGCSANTFGYGFVSNTFGEGCYLNIFGYGCSENTFGEGCYLNTFGFACSENTFGNNCVANTFGSGCVVNTFGDGCHYIKFENSCEGNTFGNNCASNTFGNDCVSNTFGDRCDSNTFGDKCHFIKLITSDELTSNKYQYYKFASGLQGSSNDDMLEITLTPNLEYETKVARKSNGKVVIYNEADLIADQN